jgi:hypothetical protein
MVYSFYWRRKIVAQAAEETLALLRPVLCDADRQLDGRLCSAAVCGSARVGLPI